MRRRSPAAVSACRASYTAWREIWPMRSRTPEAIASTPRWSPARTISSSATRAAVTRRPAPRSSSAGVGVWDTVIAPNYPRKHKRFKTTNGPSLVARQATCCLVVGHRASGSDPGGSPGRERVNQEFITEQAPLTDDFPPGILLIGVGIPGHAGIHGVISDVIHGVHLAGSAGNRGEPAGKRFGGDRDKMRLPAPAVADHLQAFVPDILHSVGADGPFAGDRRM